MNHLLKRSKRGKLSFLAGGQGDPILLLHGIPGSAFTWEATGRLLAERCQVLIPDLLGFGQSERPGEDYYLQTQAAQVRQLLDDLEIDRFYLGGHDFGGPVAVTLMRLHPELAIQGLVLSATNVFTDTPIPPPLRMAKVPILGTLMFRTMAGNRLGLRILYTAATKNKAHATWANFQRHLTPSGIDLTWRIFQRSLADLQANYQAVEESLPRIKVPTLVLWGDSDPFFATSVAERVKQAIPSSELKVYPDTGHFVPEERFQLVAQDILSFF